MNLTDLRLLVEYHYWARDRVLDAVRPLSAEQYGRSVENSFGSIHATLVHIYAAEWIWYSRWLGTSPTALVRAETYPDVTSLEHTWRELEAKVRAYLESLGEDGLTREFNYTLLNGQSSRSVFWHMLQHVVNHATYHRGQITTMLRQVGAAPPQPTDLIAYYRTLSAPQR